MLPSEEFKCAGPAVSFVVFTIRQTFLIFWFLRELCDAAVMNSCDEVVWFQVAVGGRRERTCGSDAVRVV